MSIVKLLPLTLYEQLTCAEKATWLHHYLRDPDNLKQQVTGVLTTTSPLKTLWRGGMPGYLDIPDELLHDHLASYIKTYIQRDVRSLEQVKDIEGFTDFLGIMAALTAQEINYDQLGREIDVAGLTAKKWVSLLKQSCQWRDIPPYHGNTIKRITKKRKGNLSDTGIACFLQKISTPESLRTHPLRGALLETLVANTVDALLRTFPFKAQRYHCRSSGGSEVDLIIYTGDDCYRITENFLALP